MMHWLRPLFTRRQIYRDLSEEIQQHLAEKVEALMAIDVSDQRKRTPQYAPQARPPLRPARLLRDS
jgi:hypothetical protein